MDGQQAASGSSTVTDTSDAGFILPLQGLANAIPRTKVKGAWVVPEAGLIDTLCTLYFDDVVLEAGGDGRTGEPQREHAVRRGVT